MRLPGDDRAQAIAIGRGLAGIFMFGVAANGVSGWLHGRAKRVFLRTWAFTGPEVS